MSLFRILFGLRNDLPLADRWWHRLFKVLFILLTLSIGVVALIISHGKPTLTRSNFIILDNLRTYTLKHPELADSVPSFKRLGRIAKLIDEGRYMFLFSISFHASDVMCSAKLEVHPEAYMQFVRRASPNLSAKTGLEAQKLIRKLQEQPKQMNPEQREQHKQRFREIFGVLPIDKDPITCIAKNDRNFPNSDRIVAYDFTLGAKIREWIVASIFSVVALVLWSLVILNVYYRVIIYIVYGRPSSPT